MPERAFGLRLATAAQVTQVLNAIVIKFLIIVSIGTIVYAKTWLPVILNFSFTFFALFSLICFGRGRAQQKHVLILPLLIYETVSIIWIFVWLYAALSAVVTGFMWSLEWLGGPKSYLQPHYSTTPAPGSNDSLVPGYNYGKTEEEQIIEDALAEKKKVVRFGILVMLASFVLLVMKVFGWSVTRKVFLEIRQQARDASAANSKLDPNKSLESDLAAPSPEYPVVTMKTGDNPSISYKMAPKQPPRSPRSGPEGENLLVKPGWKQTNV